MKVLALKADSSGCGFYRIEEPARVTRDLGLDIEVGTGFEIVGDARSRELVIHDIKTDADVVVLQRPLLKSFSTAVDWLQKRGIACVVEVDDDLSCVHPQNISAPSFDPKVNPIANYKILEEIAKKADLVTVTTPALADRYAKHGRVKMLPNYVPDRVFDIEKEFPDEPRLGWSGGVEWHPWDLDEAGIHVGSVLKRWGGSFSVVGPGGQVREKLFLDEQTKLSATGWVQGMGNYYSAMAKNIDIGIVPLELSRFNQAKSWLKGLEMASLGIPFVASATGPYRALAELGIGEIATKNSDWQKKLKRLITDRDAMLEASKTYRMNARQLTYEKHAQDWVDAWEQALNNRRSVQ